MTNDSIPPSTPSKQPSPVFRKPQISPDHIEQVTFIFYMIIIPVLPINMSCIFMKIAIVHFNSTGKNSERLPEKIIASRLDLALINDMF